MPFELIPPGTKIDFIGRWKICAAISLAVIVIGLVGIWKPGVRVGVDFAGGTEMQVRFTGEGAVSDDPIRQVMNSLGIASDAVVRVGEGREFLLKFEGERRIETQPVEA